MINKKHYLWALPLAFLLAACGKDEGATAVYDNAYPLVVTAQNVGFEADKAAQLYAKGENIGVSMLEEGTDNLVEPYFNVGFNSGGIGSYFTANQSDSIPVFPSNGDKRDLAAYYPRMAEVTDNQLNVDLTTEQELAFNLQFDRVSGLNKDNREAAFKLKHVFAMVSADIAPAVSYSSMKVEVKNTALKGSLNVLNGTLTESETGTLTLADASTAGRSRATTTTSNTFRAMLFPVQSQEQDGNEGEGATEIPVATVTPVIVITLLNADNAPIANPIEVKVTDYIAAVPGAINTKFEIKIDENFNPIVKVTSYPITVEDWETNGGIEVDGNEELK
jgi:lipoprotein